MTEAEIRALRDVVFEVPASDRNWESCKGAWMKEGNVQWLEEEKRKIEHRCQNQITRI